MTCCTEISAAFHDLEWKQRFRLQHGLQNPETSPFRVDRSQIITNRNRYGNVQPWDLSRVKLKKPIGGSDYVNASPIKLKSRRMNSNPRSDTSTPASGDQSSKPEGSRIESKYIASQGPKEGQFSHFWHMVMQETTGDVGVIVMLTQHYEGNKEKCAQYYPSDMSNPTIILPAHEDEDEDGSTETEDDGDPFLDSAGMSADTDGLGIDSEADPEQPTEDEGEAKCSTEEQGQSGSVALLSFNYDANIGCEVRKLRLTIGEESKLIYHYFFSAWADFQKPEAEDRMALIELAKVSKSVAGDSPRIVHCSAGVGRTGTWIALDFLLQELEAGRLLDPPQPPDTPTPTANSNDTWGKSGPPKASTPDPKEDDDLIQETVNTLREQRMMMVMNELQYSFLYDVLKDAFIEKYAEKETGPIVIEVQEPSPKVARKRSPFGGMFRGSRLGKVKGDEDIVSEGGIESEAETEIMDKSGVDVDEVGATVEDPYVAVAPETIREGQRKRAE